MRGDDHVVGGDEATQQVVIDNSQSSLGMLGGLNRPDKAAVTAARLWSR
jgi:hypothetical protein